MGYKSKKINKRRYFKRQSRKKQYGGDDSINQQQVNDEKNLEEIEPPTVVDNLKKGADIGLQLGNNIAATGLEYMEDGVQSIAESVGIDTSASIDKEIERITEKTNELAATLQTEKGQEALTNLGNIVAKVSEKVVGPGLTKVADSILDHSGPILNKATNAGMDAFSATPFGPLLDVPKFVADLANIAEDSTSMVSDVLDITKDTIEKGKESKNELEGAWSQLKNVINEGNSLVSSGLSDIQQRVDKYGTDIVKENMPKMSEVPNMPKMPEVPKMPKMPEVPNMPKMPEVPNMSQKRISAGGDNSLKQIKKESILVGGRINNAKIEFIGSNVNRSQILQQYGGKWRTKSRRSLKRKMTSRRR